VGKPNVDIVIDCRDPGTLMDFWAAALGYRKIGVKDDYGLLLPKNPSHPPVLLQRVPEPKTVKTRVHFDIRVDDVEAKARELEALGARRIDVVALRDRGGTPCGQVVDLLQRRADEIADRIRALQHIERELQHPAQRARTLDAADCDARPVCHLMAPARTVPAVGRR
jgi:Glyoxalase-like domain/MerR, DNA binding